MKRALALAALAIAAASCSSVPTISGARQLIVVRSENWDSTTGTMRRYERDAQGWKEVGTAEPVRLGRNGMAATKQEGDGKSPSGIFALGTAFGFDTAAPSRMPYRMLTEKTECVDDGRSAQYNLIVERDEVRRVDWHSSERMRAIPDYKWGIVVEHNTIGKPGDGSCIFLHLSSGKPTAGCTSMSEPAMMALLAWLDPAAKPRLVQLPDAEYARVKSEWGLP